MLRQGARRENIPLTEEQRGRSGKDRQPFGPDSGPDASGATLLLSHRALRLCSFVAPCQQPARVWRTHFLFVRWVLVALLLFATPVLAQDNATAYEALRTVGAHFNRDSLNHVISVTGVDGSPRPARWKILFEDPHARGGVHEVEVANDRIVSERTPVRPVVGSAEGSTINTSRLNLDSSGAYAVASHTAEKSHTAFSTVSYTLRTDEHGDPLWIVTLENQSRRPVGTIYIGANSGNVTRTEGMFAGASMQDVQVARDEQQGDNDNDNGNGDDEDRGIFSGPKARIKDAFHRTQDEARGMFQRVRRSFSDFINRG